MKLFIPTIGTKLELTKKWTFGLYNERRNDSLFALFSIDLPKGSYGKLIQNVSFPKGTILIVDRIYIRSGGKNMKQFDSVSFRAHLKDGTKSIAFNRWWQTIDRPKRKNSIRFWAKLNDVNEIFCKVIE